MLVVRGETSQEHACPGRLSCRLVHETSSLRTEGMPREATDGSSLDRSSNEELGLQMVLSRLAGASVIEGYATAMSAFGVTEGRTSV